MSRPLATAEGGKDGPDLLDPGQRLPERARHLPLQQHFETKRNHPELPTGFAPITLSGITASFNRPSCSMISTKPVMCRAPSVEVRPRWMRPRLRRMMASIGLTSLGQTCTHILQRVQSHIPFARSNIWSRCHLGGLRLTRIREKSIGFGQRRRPEEPFRDFMRCAGGHAGPAHDAGIDIEKLIVCGHEPKLPGWAVSLDGIVRKTGARA